MKTNNSMKTDYLIKIVSCAGEGADEPYVVVRVREGAEPEVVCRRRTFEGAELTAGILRESDRLLEENQVEDEIDDFLADHPELAAALRGAAREYAEEKREAQKREKENAEALAAKAKEAELLKSLEAELLAGLEAAKPELNMAMSVPDLVEGASRLRKSGSAAETLLAAVRGEVGL